MSEHAYRAHAYMYVYVDHEIPGFVRIQSQELMKLLM